VLDFTLNLPQITGLWGGIIAIILGVIVMIFPKILNYVVGVIFIASGVFLLFGHAWLPGVVSLIIGITVTIFPAILNYLAGIYLILLGLWFIFALGSPALIAGIVALVFGVIVMIFPAILNYLFGIYLIVTGAVVIGRYLGWF
jgi:hypothetical protein